VAVNLRRRWISFKLRKQGSHPGSRLVRFMTFALEGQHIAFEPTASYSPAASARPVAGDH
jgi:hypothetical protein